MSLLALFLALAGAAHHIDVTGRYEAVTESEYGIALTLEEGGTEEFEFRSWEAGEADSEEVERLSGRWSQTGGTVSVALQGSASARYELTPCLSYSEFGAEGCAAGLKLLETTLPEYYGLQRFGLWRADTLKVGP